MGKLLAAWRPRNLSYGSEALLDSICISPLAAVPENSNRILRSIAQDKARTTMCGSLRPFSLSRYFFFP